MENLVAIFLYSACAIVSVLLLVYSLCKLKKKRLTSSMVFLITMILAWQLLLTFHFFATDVYIARILYDLKLTFIGLSMVGLLIFIMKFYRMDAYITGNLVLMLFVVPAFTFVMGLTTNEHELIRSYEVIYTPQYHVEMHRSVWYWVNGLYCYIIIIIALVMVAVQYSKTPKAFRAPSRLILISMIINVLANLLHISDLLKLPFDPTLLGGSITVALLFIAIINNQGIDFLLRARNNILNQLSSAIFVLDNDGYVINKNVSAKKLISQLNVDENEKNFDNFLEKLSACPVKQDISSFEYEGVDYLLEQNGDSRFLNLKRQEVFDKANNSLGMMVTVEDVTENRHLLSRLEDEAGRDALTGLFNRRYMWGLLPEIDIQKNTPLMVLMCDLNGLKRVNDTLGHQFGDMLIRVAANALVSMCPPAAHIARVGGDEFLVLIPSCTAHKAAALVLDIKKHVKGLTQFPFKVSMALGFAIKNDSLQKIDDIISFADKAMYTDKALKNSEIKDSRIK